MKTTHTAKTTAEVRKSNRYTREIHVPFIRIRGQWLKQHGFNIGTTAYIIETPEGLLITPNPPAELTPLETIKAQFKSLNIPTER